MGYNERNCFICGVRFNMASLRWTNEPLKVAWDSDGDRWRPGIDPKGDEDEPNPKVIIPHRVNGQIIGHECEGNFGAFYVKGEGIEKVGACERAGCDEYESDHACGGPGCGYVLPGGKGNPHGWSTQGYNGWRISDEEMRIMTCVQAIVPVGDLDAWQPEDDDDKSETSRLVLTAVSESVPDDWQVNHAPFRHGIDGVVMIDDVGLGD